MAYKRRSEVEPSEVYALGARELPVDPTMHEFQNMEDPASGLNRGRGGSPVVDDLGERARSLMPKAQKPTVGSGVFSTWTQ